jgi:sucrose-6-phosphate hydrolase SacC (GH32 family)
LGKVRFFSSDDLKNWNVLSDFDRRWVYECMDMVPLKVDGDPDKIKWLIYDASFDYEVGAFDGTTLTTDKTTLLGDYGDAYYAAQTFNNSPDDRTVIIGWLKTKKNNIFWDNNMPFNQQMAFPATLELKNTSLGVRLFRWPVEEIKSLYEKSQIYENVKKTSLNRKMKKINFDGVDLYGAFDRRQNADFTINIRGNILKYENGNFYFEGKTLPTLKNDKVNFRVLLDRATIEIFTDNGFSVLSNYTSPNTENTSINISSEKNMIFDSFEVHKVGSIWQ